MYNLNIEPRDYQKPILNVLVDNLEMKGYIRGILQAKPGTGKTFMSIYFSQIFEKVLVIVPKDILVDQWIKEFLNFTDLTEDDIGEIKGSDLKQIKEVLNKKVIITKPQSLLSQIKRINYNELYKLYSVVDLVVYDECHGAGAEGYSKSLSLFSTMNILGLTATPFRNGLNEFLLYNSIGDVLISAEADVLVPDIYIRKLPEHIANFNENEKKAIQSKTLDYPMMLAFHNKFLLTKEPFFDHLTDWIKWAHDQNRKAIILFSSNKLVDVQMKNIEKKYPDIFKNALSLTGNSKKDALKIAKSKNKTLKEKLKKYKEELNIEVKNKNLKRKEADALYNQERDNIKKISEININNALELYNEKIKKADIIISNYMLLKEGFDKDDLSFVIFGSPIIGKITIIQTLGRITRTAENKPKPIALFPLTDIFLSLNKRATTIINNNIKLAYPQASIKYV